MWWSSIPCPHKPQDAGHRTLCDAMRSHLYLVDSLHFFVHDSVVQVSLHSHCSHFHRHLIRVGESVWHSPSPICLQWFLSSSSHPGGAMAKKDKVSVNGKTISVRDWIDNEYNHICKLSLRTQSPPFYILHFDQEISGRGDCKKHNKKHQWA